MEQTGAEYQQQAADGCGTYYNTAAFEHNYADISDVGGIELHNARPELSYEEPIRDQRPKVIQESKESRQGWMLAALLILGVIVIALTVVLLMLIFSGKRNTCCSFNL